MSACIAPDALPSCLASGARQTWRDLGRLFNPARDGLEGWTHAAYPMPMRLPDGRVRVFYTARDPDRRGHLFAQDFRFRDGTFAREGGPSGPLLRPGARGEFDQAGTAATCFVARGRRILCYYLGWTNRTDVPFQNYIGLAVADGWDGPFRRVGRVPALDRSARDPVSVGYPEVYRDARGQWRMLYGSHRSWGADWLEMDHPMNHAVSRAGARWRAEPRPALDLAGPADPDEFALSKPTVLVAGGRYHLWYARRHAHYVPGYAVSEDGIDWVRRDGLAGRIATPTPGFNDEAVTYPAVFVCEGRVFLFYNGNRYGLTGFGALEIAG